MKTGTVYTETVVHAPPEQFAADAPYQLAIVSLDTGGHETVRILPDSQGGDRVQIGDKVEFAEDRNNIPFYRKC